MAFLSRNGPRLVLTFAFFIRVMCLVLGNRPLEYDESVAFVAATGHESVLERLSLTREAPVSAWVPAREWRKYLELDPAFGYADVRDGRAEWSIHPPLYYWLLRFVSQLLGTVTVRGALFLNLLLDVCSGLLLYRFAHFAFEETGMAEASVALWSVSAAVLTTFATIGPFSLFQATTICAAVACQTIVRSNASRAWSTLLLGVALSAGLLTDYAFIFVALGFVLITAAFLGRNPKYVLPLAYATLGAVAVAVVANPHFYTGIANERLVRDPFHASAIGHRVVRTVSAFLGFMATAQWLRGLVAVLLAVVVVYLVRAHRWGEFARKPAFEGALLLWILVVFAVPYILQLTPRYAMGDAFGAPLWPMLAVAMVALLARLPRPILGAAGCVIIVGFASTEWLGGYVKRASPPPLPGADYAIVDSRWRGVLLPVIWRLDPNALVFAANPRELAALSSKTLERPRERGLYFEVASGSGKSDADDVESASRRVEEGKCAVALVGDVTLLQDGACADAGAP